MKTKTSKKLTLHKESLGQLKLRTGMKAGLPPYTSDSARICCA